MEQHSLQSAATDPESPERREFTVMSVLALLSGVTITITGCNGDDSPTSPGSGGSGSGGVSATVLANHGHTARIESAQLTAGNAVTLNIRGTATHPHTVELTSQEVSQIAAGQRISKTSSTDDSPDAGRHSHGVTFN